MPTTDLTAAPVPSANDADNVPADLLALANHYDRHVFLHATNEANRDTLYPNPVDGTVCTSTVDGTEWVYANGAWTVRWAPVSDWVTCSLANGLAGPLYVRSQYIGGKRMGYLRGTLSRPSGERIPGSWFEGDRFATLPPTFVPDAQYGSVYAVVPLSLAGYATVPAGRINIDPATGDIYVYGNQDASNNYVDAAWVSFDGGWFWIDY